MTPVRAGAPALMMDPSVLRNRDTLPAELSVEFFLGRPFQELVEEARRTGQCDAEDLVAMGWTLYGGMISLARGEVSAVSVEKRLPRRGEFGRAQAVA